jgi:hypothetical protein
MLRLSVFSIEPGAINHFGRFHGLVQYVYPPHRSFSDLSET